MRIVLFSVLILIGLAGATTAYSAACPQGWAPVSGSCVNPPDLEPPPLPAIWTGPPPIVTTADRAAELMAEYRLKVLTWDTTAPKRSFVLEQEEDPIQAYLRAERLYHQCIEGIGDQPSGLSDWFMDMVDVEFCQMEWYENAKPALDVEPALPPPW